MKKNFFFLFLQFIVARLIYFRSIFSFNRQGFLPFFLCLVFSICVATITFLSLSLLLLSFYRSQSIIIDIFIKCVCVCGDGGRILDLFVSGSFTCFVYTMQVYHWIRIHIENNIYMIRKGKEQKKIKITTKIT